jgi:hypothetical protein
MKMSGERRWGGIGGVGEKRVEDESEGGGMLFGARGKNGPPPLPIGSAFRAAGSLSGGTVNHHPTDGLFRPVVGRLDRGMGKEAKIRIAMFPEAFGDILRRLFRRCATKYEVDAAPGAKDGGWLLLKLTIILY